MLVIIGVNGMSRDLFVAKIPASFSVDALRDLFSQAGTISQLKRPRDYDTGELRSFAFITMETAEEGLAAIAQFNGYVIDGQAIVVKESDKPFQAGTPRPAAPRPVSPPPPPPPPPAPTVAMDFYWDDRVDILEDLLLQTGVATTVKMTLVGRPGRIEEQGNTVMVAMQHFLRRHGYPRGVPVPPDTPTQYLLFISSKQWKKVAPALAEQPDDLLIVEGQGIFDPEIPGMSIFVTSVTTRTMQQASRLNTNEAPQPE